MSRIITKNRDPRVNEFGPNDLVLNTTTGDLFIKSNNQLFKIIGRNQFDQTTTDAILQLLDEEEQTIPLTTSKVKNLKIPIDGFYKILTSKPLTGSNVSLHGGIPVDYSQPLPNSPYIKTNGGLDILMDNANSYDNSEFRIFKDTGIANVTPGVELLKIDNNGNLTVAGTISGSSVLNTEIDGGSF